MLNGVSDKEEGYSVKLACKIGTYETVQQCNINVPNEVAVGTGYQDKSD